jgi:hypothetical protein
MNNLKIKIQNSKFWKIFLVSSLSLILLFSFLFFMLPAHIENVDKKQSDDQISRQISRQISQQVSNQAFQFSKNPEIQQVKPKKPVRIKLKRTAKGVYSWDLTGDDIDEILKIDKQLRRTFKKDLE